MSTGPMSEAPRHAAATEATSEPSEQSTGQNQGVVLIPVKAFDKAKGRLSVALPGETRADLAQQMATHVVTVQQHVAVAVCCDDAEVAAWAESLGALVIWCPGTDLIGAVQQGTSELRAAGYPSIAVAHGDLPLAKSLHGLLGWHGVTLVPDRHRTGTNVITFPTSIDFEFSYGTSSLQRHVAEAVRHRRGVRIVHDADLGWDVDQPADLDVPNSDQPTDQQLLTNLRNESTS